MEKKETNADYAARTRRQDIGSALRSIRGEFPLAPFAALFGDTADVWESYERGEKLPPLDLLPKIEKLTGYPAQGILYPGNPSHRRALYRPESQDERPRTLTLKIELAPELAALLGQRGVREER